MITHYPLLLNFIQEVKEPSFLLIELLSILTNPFEQALNTNVSQFRLLCVTRGSWSTIIVTELNQHQSVLFSNDQRSIRTFLTYRYD